MNIKNVTQLGLKELFSLRSDPVLIILIIYIFSVAVYSVAKGVDYDVDNAAIAVVDEDQTELSREITFAFLPPQFKAPDVISTDEVYSKLDRGEYLFVVFFPPNFEKDVLAGRQPEVQVLIDATAIAQAGNGAAYIQQIIQREALNAMYPGTELTDLLPVQMTVRKLYNPNSSSVWFNSLMQVINSITILGVVLTGAALIREREHGTVEHLLVMPVTPAEIMLAKIWANSLVILLASILSLQIVVNWWLEVPVKGSVSLYIFACILYLFSVTSLGVMLGIITNSMAQFALLLIPIVIIMYLLSGGTTPLESMPEWLQYVMQFSPSTHFVELSQNILYRGATIDNVWPQLVILSLIGCIFYTIALLKFRKAIVSMG
jgi:ABC-2 type transport system permease protein